MGTALLALGSCTRQEMPTVGEAICFTAEAVADAPEEGDTRIAYGSASGSTMAIRWNSTSDRVSIWSPEAVQNGDLNSHPDASYRTSSVSGGNVTGITAVSSSTQLMWNEDKDQHVFYGRYPDPSWSNAAGYSNTTFRNQSRQSSTFNCYLPASFSVSTSSGTYSYTQNMTYCYMTAYTSVSKGSTVNLSFTPAVSTYKINISHSISSGLTVSSVKLTSASHRMNGNYTVGIAANRTFNVPESSLAASAKSVTANFSSALSVPSGTTLSVTLFACPVTANDITLTLSTNYGDLSLPLKASGGSNLSFQAGKFFNVNCKAITSVSTEIGSSVMLVQIGSITDTSYSTGGSWTSDSFPFTVDAQGHQVCFAPGNLQYTKSTNTWSFMTTPYATVETSSQNVGTNYANQDVVSLFGWATSGYNGKYPYMTTTSNTEYGPNITSGQFGADWDWGKRNAISNGGGYTWRTLTSPEWVYILSTRPGNRFAKAQVNGRKGVIIFPDNFDPATVGIAISSINAGDVNYPNTINLDNWGKLAAKGCAFLPCAGYRTGESVSSSSTSWGEYWSSTPDSSLNTYAMSVRFIGSSLNPACDTAVRSKGCSVRLVRDL